MEGFHSFSDLTSRDKAIFVGLFLSRFGQDALDAFEFSGYKQAFNVLGYSLGAQPNSIKNYRDEFDPYFPNGREGWHNRPLRDYCKNIMTLAENLTFEEFCYVIKLYISNSAISLEDVKRAPSQDHSNHEFSAERLITGKAAEQYFVQNYRNIDLFDGYEICDTTCLGCGFDFKLTKGLNRYYVEVKGLNAKQGDVLLTDKEYNTAQELEDLYCLFVVRNFQDKPCHAYYFNPIANSAIVFEKYERQIMQTSYHGIFL